jgi:Ca2+-transporting ATPase
MERPPRSQSEGVFAGGLGFGVVYQGILVALLTIGSYHIVDIWHGHEVAMTAAFLTMSMCEIFHAFNMRAQRQSIFTLRTNNPVLIGAAVLSLALTLAVIYIPVLAGIFSLEPLTSRELIVSLGMSVVIIPLVEIVKAFERARTKRAA